MNKSPDAFRTISEVAEDLDLPQHVLRFWETRFNQIKPLKRGGGRRYYRPEDVELLRGIRHLLYSEGYTIKGVQRILKEHGNRFVMSVAEDGFDAALLDAAPTNTPTVAEENKRQKAADKKGGILGKLVGKGDADDVAAAAADAISKQNQKKLNAALMELLECKRILERARGV